MSPRLILLAIFVVLLVGLLASGPAEAHAQYVSSTPTASSILPFASAPNQVTVTLSEAIQAGTGTIRVTNATGARFDLSPVTLAEPRTLAVSLSSNGPGIYTVTWTVISAVDGHFTAGSFSYGVQNPNGSFLGTLPSGGATTGGPPVSPVEVAFRSIGFLGLAVLLGVAVLANFMWLPAGRDPDVQASPSYALGFPVLLNVGRIAAFTFTASMFGLFALTTGFEGSTAAQGLAASSYLQSVSARLVIGVSAFVLLSRAFARSRTAKPETNAWTIQASLLVSVAAIVAGSFGTHAAATPVLTAIGILADAAHLAGVGLWVGGLAGIVAVRRLLREEDAAPLARIVLGRFSRLAGYAVGLVLAGGIVLALLLVGTWNALFGTAYGWVILGKIALFAPMIALGAFNRYWLIPRTAEDASPVDAVRRLVRNVRFEVTLGIAVLVLAGLLTSMTPAVSVAAGPVGVFSLETVTDGIRVHMETQPYPTVPTAYTFEVLLYYDSNGTLFNFARNGTMKFTLVDDPHVAPQTENLTSIHGFHYVLSTTALSAPGLWRIDAMFSRIDGFDFRVTFYLTIRASP